MARLQSLLTKLSPEELAAYETYLADMESRGYIERVYPETEKDAPRYYLPHRGLIQKSKLRVVFDGGAHAAGSPAINRLVDEGPNLLQNLVMILLRFRCFEEPMQNDLKAAFLQISVHPDDRIYMRFLWKDGIVYQFRRVLFGLSCSPYLLNSSLRFLLSQFETTFPQTVKILKKSIYVDDIVCCVDKAVADSFQTETTEIFNSVGIELKEWCAGITRNPDPPYISSVLGIRWDRQADSLSVNLDHLKPISGAITRRKLLKAVSTPFDPLGVLNYWTVKGRSLLQESWKEKGTWDEPLSTNLQKKCHSWIESAPSIKAHIPRQVMNQNKENIELHLCCDASETAYAACIYVVNRPISSMLLISRFRCAPVKKKLSIPRLELLAALIGTRLLKFVRESDDIFLSAKTYCWTDSEAVRFWLKAGPYSLKLFESNRVKEILDSTLAADWNRIHTSENPADLATRGSESKEGESLWWHGPPFLLQEPEHWPRQPECQEPINPPIKEGFRVSTVVTEENNAKPSIPYLPFHVRSRADKAFRILALVLKSVQCFKAKKKLKHAKIGNVPQVNLTRLDHQRARDFVVRVGQLQDFEEDFSRLKTGHQVLRSSRLAHLHPSYDTQRNLIMVHPRVNEGNPLPLLSTNFPFFKWIVQDRHIRILHGGPQATMAELCRSYHVLKGLQSVKKALRITCYNCRRTKGIPFRSKESALPNFRINPCRPFSHTGVDFLGPLLANGSKCYVLLFTCAVVRAIHLELSESMNVTDTQMAFRRFQARRGTPTKFYSDNASNFIKLKDMTTCEWSMIPPYAPWWGGFYERMVKTVKQSLRSSLMNRKVSFVEIQTILAEIEEAVNRRPLYQITTEANPLTPFHFIYGSAPAPETLPVPDLSGEILGKVWKNRLLVSHEFWRSFRHKYLSSLRSWRRTKLRIQREPKVDEIVLVEDKNTPRLRWNFARILEIHPHSAIILMNGRRTSRAIKCLYPLEAEEIIEAKPVVQGDVPNLQSSIAISMG